MLPHLAVKLEENKTFRYLKYYVLRFLQKSKPRILRIEMYFLGPEILAKLCKTAFFHFSPNSSFSLEL
jgi:hypothetical protein